MKIVYCLNSIRGIGGIENVTLAKANELAKIEGNDIYIIVTDNWEKHVLMQEISPQIHLIHIPVNYYKDDYKSRLHLYKSRLRIFKHFYFLQKEVNKINPDVIISVGEFDKFLVPKLRTKAVKIREFHFNSTCRYYSFKKKWEAKFWTFIDNYFNAKGFDKIVLLTKEDKNDNFPHNDKYTYIPNPLTITPPKFTSNHLSHSVATAGRLVKEKDFMSLIRAWKYVHDVAPDWELNIYGEGSERVNLTNLIKQLKLENCINLKGYTNNISAELTKSSIFVLSSLYEGFPLVILEAMSCGLPVIAFACPYGPRELIIDRQNGFLVENRDEQKLAGYIIKLIQHQDLRKQMGEKAQDRANDFDISSIVTRWMNLFNEEILKKS